MILRKNWVYILTNKRNGTLYTGSTSNLALRITQHKSGSLPGFASKYGLTQLVWFEEFSNYKDAIETEHRIKRWRRQWKIDLIEKSNPNWDDLDSQLY